MKVRTAVIGVVGLVLIGWAVAAPLTAPYLFGLLLLSGALVDWLVHRPGAQPPATGARRTLGVGAAGVGVLVLVVGVGVPLGVRYLPSTAGVLWRSQVTGMRPVVVAEHLFLGADGTGGTDQALVAIDLADGTRDWSVPGDGLLTRTGAVVVAGEGQVRFVGPDGTEAWRVPVQGTVQVLAAEDGYVILSECPTGGAGGGAACSLTGLDPHGQVAWQRDTPELFGMTVDDQTTTAHSGRTLPAAAVVADEEDPQVRLIDPATGDRVAAFDRREWPTLRVYADTLLALGVADHGCPVEAYDLTDGARRWHVEDICSGGSEVPYPSTSFRRDGSHVYLTAAGHALVLDLADGAARELRVSEFGPVPRVPLDVALTYSTADDLALTWYGTELRAAEASTGQQRWTATVPGEQVWRVAGGDGTLAVVSFAGRGHNPLMTGEDAAYVSVLDAADGSVVSSTLLPGGVVRAVVVADHQVLVQQQDRTLLVGER